MTYLCIEAILEIIKLNNVYFRYLKLNVIKKLK